jgi:hypothetical protein
LENLITSRGEGTSIEMATNTVRIVGSFDNIMVLLDVLETADVLTAISAVEVLYIHTHKRTKRPRPAPPHGTANRSAP